LRAKAVKVSLSCRCASAAIVSNTIDDFPEPETPVNTVILRLGMVSETFLRLFSRAPVILMNSVMAPLRYSLQRRENPSAAG